MKKVTFKLNELMGKHRVRSIRKLSEDTGINRYTLSKMYDNELTRMDAATLSTLCNYFGCELHELIDLTDKE
ncbi:helix-turn-helix domain-containing protein [Ornithinibacillus xuwenensis]|uniref:Helix-turn-helix transcriptional regulator n=1 Tax=Ornithinibacillus xuwenensis TaxID=3144668 RepID=A0ABU9XF06_9BACI